MNMMIVPIFKLFELFLQKKVRAQLSDQTQASIFASKRFSTGKQSAKKNNVLKINYAF
jgi:hypothetical protein